jgi:hypothetical protein
MPISRGDDWGHAEPAPADLTIVADDAALHRYVVERRSRGLPLDPVGIERGDLARTMGGGTGNRFPGIVVNATVDILRVEVDGAVTWCTSHVVGRRCDSWWRGEVLFAMNAQFLGGYDLAPRGHPNDGRVELLRVDRRMTWRARQQARRRALTGTHLPHPDIAASTVGTTPHNLTFSRPLDLWLDGVKWRRARSVVLTVEADALVVFA